MNVLFFLFTKDVLQNWSVCTESPTHTSGYVPGGGGATDSLNVGTNYETTTPTFLQWTAPGCILMMRVCCILIVRQSKRREIGITLQHWSLWK